MKTFLIFLMILGVAIYKIALSDDDSALSDHALLERVIRHEADRAYLPSEYQYDTVSELLLSSHRCCSIQREDHLHTPKPSLFDLIIEYDAIFITVGYPSKIEPSSRYVVHYLVSPTGEIGDRFGSPPR